MVFKQLENAFPSQNIESWILLIPPGKNFLRVLLIILQAEGNYSFPQAAFFSKICFRPAESGWRKLRVHIGLCPFHFKNYMKLHRFHFIIANSSFQTQFLWLCTFRYVTVYFWNSFHKWLLKVWQNSTNSYDLIQWAQHIHRYSWIEWVKAIHFLNYASHMSSSFAICCLFKTLISLNWV